MEVERPLNAMALFERDLVNGNEVGERSAAPSLPPRSVPERGRTSVWWPLLLRVLGGAGLLLGLAGIGIAATRAEHKGTLASAWLATATPSSAAFEVGSSAAPQIAAAPALDGAPVSSVSVAVRTLEPTAAEAPSGCQQSDGNCQPAAPTSGITADGKVILNLANAAELQRLPGIGATRAEAILALRARLKKFRRPTELLQVRGIGPRGLQRLLPHMVVDAPAAAEPRSPPAPTDH